MDLHLLRGSIPGSAATELALTHALLDRASAGEGPATLRLYRPTATLAFGRLDALRPSYAEAIVAARVLGFDPVLRSPGGRAAAYHEGSLVIELVTPEASPRSGIARRFDAMAGLIVAAVRRLGVEPRVGELPGEYCPGPYSIITGNIKLGGIAQRVVAQASLVSVAVVVSGGGRVRAVLESVYRCLGYDFDPSTAGALEDADAAITTDALEREVVRAYAARYRLTPVAPDDELLAAARALERAHAPGSARGRA